MTATQFKPLTMTKSMRLRNRLETHAEALEVIRDLANLQLAIASMPSLDRLTQLQMRASKVLAMAEHDAGQLVLARQALAAEAGG